MADDTYSIAAGASLYAGTAAPTDPPPSSVPLVFSATPSVGTSAYGYQGQWTIEPGGYYDLDGWDFIASYAVKKTLPAVMRLCISQHASGGYGPSGMSGYPASANSDITLKNQDGQAKKDGGLVDVTEWWTMARDGVAYAQRRNAGAIAVLMERYPQIDIDNLGIIVEGTSMGGGGVNATMRLPDPYRAKIAFARGSVGVMMYRLINGYSTADLSHWPAAAGNVALWDSCDFQVLAATDAVVRGMHYRQRFSSNDPFSRGVANSSTQLIWLKTCHDHKISAVATYVSNGHNATEAGYVFPDVTAFEVAQQNVTLDRAHPCFTNSSGNYPPNAADIPDNVNYPRGHYNLGLTWDHANIVDTLDEIVFPIKYTRRTGFGGVIPDQPASITVSVTPRRPRNFQIINGASLNWSFDGGAASGVATVQGDTVTASGIPLTSGDAFKPLRFFKPFGQVQGDVLIRIWGQSNAEGRALRTDVDAAPLNSDAGLSAFMSGTFDRVWIWTGSAFAKLTPLSNSQSGASAFGPEFGLAVEWMRRTTTGNLYLEKTAAGGLSITSFEPGVGSRYLTGQTEKSQQDAWLASRGITFSASHMLWVQGEADYTQTQAWYQPRLENLMAAWTANGFLTPTSRVVLSQMPPGTSRYGSGVTAAKDAIAAANPGLVNALLLPAYMNADNLHYNGRGQVQHAYDVYAYLFDTTSSST